MTLCPLECSIKEFSGSLSFSQISSQATHTAIYKDSSLISEAHLNAVELFNRLVPDLSYKSYMNDMFNVTKAILDSVGKKTTFLAKFSRAVELLNVAVIQNDCHQLQGLISTLLSHYKNNFQTSRHKALAYFSEVVSAIHDLSREMFQVTTFFNDIEDAIWYYKSLSTIMDKVLTSSKLTISYLFTILADDTSAKSEPYTNTTHIFYNDSFHRKYCSNVYTNAIQSLTTQVPLFIFASQRLSFWQQALLSMQNIKDSNFVYSSQAASLTVNDTLSVNLWTLLNCTECNKEIASLSQAQWKTRLLNIINTLSVELVSSCLLQYETYLNLIYDDVTDLLLPVAPQWSDGGLLEETAQHLDTLNEQLFRLIRSYLYGNLTKKVMSIAGHELLQKMAVEIELISSSNTEAYRSWLAELVAWQSEAIFLYNTVSEHLQLLSYFTANNDNFRSVVNALKIWQQPIIKIYPVVNLTYEVISGWNDTKIFAASSMTSYLSEQARNIIRTVFDNVVQAASDEQQTFETHQMEVLPTVWKENYNVLINLFTVYLNSLLYSNDFIGYFY